MQLGRKKNNKEKKGEMKMKGKKEAINSLKL